MLADFAQFLQVSAEGFEFVIERRCALMSGTIKVPWNANPVIPSLHAGVH